MKIRHSASILAFALALAACDNGTGSSTAPSASKDGSALVGSWKMPSGNYASQYFVFRTNGTGKAVSIAGTRCVVTEMTWQIQGDSLALTKNDTVRRVSFAIRNDTLALYSPGLFGPNESDFLRASEPDLTPAEGDRPTSMVGRWRRFLPSVTESYSDNVLTGRDTIWNPELVSITADGVAEIVGFESGQTCDSTWKCTIGPVPSDTLRYRWWTSGTDLYLQIRSFIMVSHPQASQIYGENGGVQVMGWSASSDSLHLKAYFEPYPTQDYARMP
jgi:hypothetical protein